MTNALSKSYGIALFESLQEKKIDLNQALIELTQIEEIVEDNKINKFLVHPNIDKNEKIRIMEEALKKFNKTVSSFILVLIENDRISELKGIIESFQEELYELNGIINVEIITKEELSKDLSKKIIKYLESSYQKKVISKEIVDETILGGIIVKVNGMVTDDSILNKLKAIKDAVLSSK
jgi:F-type H+-transporting ATPase subunit delta